MEDDIGNGWLLWTILMLFIFSVFGYLAYTFRTKRKFYKSFNVKSAKDVLNERYARGEIHFDEYERIKFTIIKKQMTVSQKTLST